MNKYYTNTALYTLLYIYSVSKYSLYCVCIWLCVALNGFQVKRVSFFCVCCLHYVVQSPWSVGYIILALHQSTSCFKSIQTSTATEETVHCICISAAQVFFRPKQLELFKAIAKWIILFFFSSVLFQILWIVT